MSFQALGWAAGQRPKRPADKLILYGLADRHNTEDDAAWPSIAWLVDFSGLDRKTVIAGLDRLQEGGYARDTGLRVGDTSQVKVYALALEKPPEIKQSQKRNRSVFPLKESQKRDTEPVKEPVSQKASPSSKALKPRFSFARPDGVDPQAWKDFLANRKLKRMKNTPTAHKRMMDDIRRLERKGWSAAELIQHAAEKGWGGIYEPDARAGFSNGQTRGDGFDHIGSPMVRTGLRAEAARRANGHGARGEGRSFADSGAGGSGGSEARGSGF